GPPGRVPSHSTPHSAVRQAAASPRKTICSSMSRRNCGAVCSHAARSENCGGLMIRGWTKALISLAGWPGASKGCSSAALVASVSSAPRAAGPLQTTMASKKAARLVGRTQRPALARAWQPNCRTWRSFRSVLRLGEIGQRADVVLHLFEKRQQIGHRLRVDGLFQSLGHERLAGALDLVDVRLEDRLALAFFAGERQAGRRFTHDQAG